MGAEESYLRSSHLAEEEVGSLFSRVTECGHFTCCRYAEVIEEGEEDVPHHREVDTGSLCNEKRGINSTGSRLRWNGGGT